MKRTNVIVDEDLLEEARRLSGERTYSATIGRALAEFVRRAEFRIALKEFQDEAAASGSFFDREYVERMWPEAAARVWPKRRVSADERRAPRKIAKQAKSRDSR